MKRLIYMLMSVLALCCITSCSSDDDNSDNGGTQSSSFDLMEYLNGSWYIESVNEEIRYSKNGTLYDKYCTVFSSAETQGKFTVDNEKESMYVTYNNLGDYSFEFRFTDISDFSYTANYDGGTDYVEKIVESHQMSVGESESILFSSNYPSYTVNSYKSTNESIATVSSDGVVKAMGGKGTAYIKISAEGVTAWAKVIVGDDCRDMWFDYPSLIGKSSSLLSGILGDPYEIYTNGYLYSLGIHEVLFASRATWNTSTKLVNEIDIFINTNIPDKDVTDYLKAHYYPYSRLGDNFYTTYPTIEKSSTLVYWDQSERSVAFKDAKCFALPDYTSAFGKTSQEIKAEYGNVISTLYYTINNPCIYYVYFYTDEETDKVTDIMLGVNEDISEEDMCKALDLYYSFRKHYEDDNVYVYDGENNLTVVYFPESIYISFYINE